MITSQHGERVLSGMRPTGALHFGHYHGVLKNWVRMQHEYDCYFCVVDWHALTTHYEDPSRITEWTWEVVIDWLAAGVDPSLAKLFIQSQVPEHAELHLLLSMFTPLAWLERVPTYKDQQEKLADRDLTTYGFLGYPLLQTADILVYRAGQVPVGEDQVPHVEMSREVARRFNFLYGREPGYEDKAEEAIRKMGKRNARLYRDLKRRFQEQGDDEALQTAQAMLEDQQNLTIADKERLFGFLEGGGRVLLPEPAALLTEAPRVPGLDGQKMSKSYGNTLMMREDPDDAVNKLRTMTTDPARVRRTDPGDPAKCPVFDLHKIYSDEKTRDWVQDGCTTAGIGCLDCKAPLIDAVLEDLKQIRQRAEPYVDNPALVRTIIAEGTEAARDAARETMDDVRDAMGLKHR